MDRRRHVFPRLVALAAILGLVVLGLGGPGQAIYGTRPGHVASASVAQGPPTRREHPFLESSLRSTRSVRPSPPTDHPAVVWSDYLDGTRPQIVARVDASGAVLGEFAVSPSPPLKARRRSPKRHELLVVWEEGGDLSGRG